MANDVSKILRISPAAAALVPVPESTGDVAKLEPMLPEISSLPVAPTKLDRSVEEALRGQDSYPDREQLWMALRVISLLQRDSNDCGSWSTLIENDKLVATADGVWVEADVVGLSAMEYTAAATDDLLAEVEKSRASDRKASAVHLVEVLEPSLRWVQIDGTDLLGADKEIMPPFPEDAFNTQIYAEVYAPDLTPLLAAAEEPIEGGFQGALFELCVMRLILGNDTRLHMLHIWELAGGHTGDYLVPTRFLEVVEGAAKMYGLTKERRFLFRKEGVSSRVGPITVHTPYLNQQYPDYRPILSAEFQGELMLDRDYLISLLAPEERMLGKDELGTVTLTAGYFDLLNPAAGSLDGLCVSFGGARMQVIKAFQGEIPGKQLTLRLRHLLSAISQCHLDTLRLSFRVDAGSVSAVRIKEDDYQAILMAL